MIAVALYRLQRALGNDSPATEAELLTWHRFFAPTSTTLRSRGQRTNGCAVALQDILWQTAVPQLGLALEELVLLELLSARVESVESVNPLAFHHAIPIPGRPENKKESKTISTTTHPQGATARVVLFRPS